ncbi:hypothetical protein Rsub_02976 [Raphidocelis subcapitata]|uniref:Uncharacterized protein n=1 Tax=Raphidocelis subcapitata TaxID=307507 RepID=A0A2V0P0G6_9CHLO|nr:hypothetical protein Rsub_02976 [Raphidocelis subcapitata]|eukprot:GBF90677.1 hypothetical protein Rsub_02976 [Raphidocelis subcapitata]
MAAVAKKSGRVNPKEYQADFFCKQLGPLVAHLNAQIPDQKHEARSLGQMVAQMLQFQEDALGVDSLPPRDFPKLPLALFEDAAPGGGLSIVAARLAAIRRSTPNFKGFEWSNPGQRRFNLEALAYVRADLLRAGLLKVPVVAVDATCGAEKDRAAEAARKLGATVVENPADPSVTHVLYPNGALCIAEDDPASQMRTLQTSGQRARVHWRFLPPSYAEWVALRSAPTLGAERSEPPGGRLPWRVTLRWVLDSEKYNEWMHPQDYEADQQKAATVAEAEAAAVLGVVGDAAGSKRAAAALAAAQAAGLTGKRGRGDAEVVAADPGEEVAPSVRKRRVLNPHRAAVEGGATAENISQGQLDPTAAVAVLDPPPQGERQPEEQQQQQRQAAAADGGLDDGGAPVRGHRYLVPMHASWFGFFGIHSHERRALPELLNGSITGFNVSTYLALRNGLVALYRRQPERRLTVEDACAALRQYNPAILQRVHTFLEGWGIINWLAAAQPQLPAAAALPAGTRLAPSTAGARARLPPGVTLSGRSSALQARTQKGGSAAALLQLRTPTTAEGVAAACGGGTLPMTGRDSRAGRLEPITSLAGDRRFFCAAMPWVDCTALRYHCTKTPGVDLCPQAYAEGRFPPGTAASDFVRLEGGADASAPDTVGVSAGKWTPQETLLLLEGLEAYGDKWALVSEHVRTHPIVECIAHFLQLPIEDDFLDELEARARGSGGSAGAAGGTTQPAQAAAAEGAGAGAAAIGRVPLEGIEAAPTNPVVSSVALMSVLLAPRIGAEAAAVALEALASDDPVALAAAIEAARRGRASPRAANGADAAAAMEVDGDEGGAGSGEQQTTPDPARPVTSAQTSAAAIAALAAGAARAKLMADEQTAEMERLTRRVVRAQLARVGIKLKFLERVDQVLEVECAKQKETLQSMVEEKAAADVRRRK